MKAERLWEALGEVGDSYIEEILVQTDKINGKSRKGRLWKTAAAAVLLAFCFFTGSSPAGGGGAGFLSGTVSDITRCGTIFYSCPGIL